MNLDQRAHNAGAALRSAHANNPDVSESYPRLLVAVRRRALMRVVAAALVVAAATAGGVGIALSRSDTVGPGPVEEPPATSSPGVARTCAQTFFHCGGGSRITMSLPVPATWTVKPPFSRHLHFVTEAGTGQLVLAESYRNDTPQPAGVTVAEGVRATKADRLADIDPTAPASARGLAEWVSRRPFLRSGAVQRTPVGGLPAWTVQVRLRAPGRLGVADCNQLTTRCMPVLAMPAPNSTVLGAWGPMIARYTFVNVPGAGPTVIWSWTFGATHRALNANQSLIDSLRFATG
jgi:hypothetical protein